MMYQWYEAGSKDDLPDGKVVEKMVGEKTVALLRKETIVYAFAATCPHSGAKLCEGWLDMQGRIVCPLHKYRFDPANGRNTSGEGYKLKTYPLEIRDGLIFIGLITETI